MKHIVFFAVFVFGVVSLYADSDTVFNSPLNAADENRFDEVCTKLSGNDFLKGKFNQTKTIVKINKRLKSSGTFVISKNDGIIWKTEKPFASTTAVGKDFIVQASANGSISKIDAGKNDTFMRISETLRSVFTGNSKSIKDNFFVFFIESTNGSKSEWSIGLVPKEKEFKTFAKSIILKGSTLIAELIIEEESGDTIQWELFDYIYPKELDQNEKNIFFTK
ncbi:MAG: outer membrane lipoprotein carrier protein LolA [Spirochaetaceae bacterium]|jgi:hypothetical protein|nr:outer membrane lipoprotein carrier protein LolA [Spirochaetaceae bacterium]